MTFEELLKDFSSKQLVIIEFDLLDIHFKSERYRKARWMHKIPFLKMNVLDSYMENNRLIVTLGTASDKQENDNDQN